MYSVMVEFSKRRKKVGDRLKICHISGLKKREIHLIVEIQQLSRFQVQSNNKNWPMKFKWLSEIVHETVDSLGETKVVFIRVRFKSRRMCWHSSCPSYRVA